MNVASSKKNEETLVWVVTVKLASRLSYRLLIRCQSTVLCPFEKIQDFRGPSKVHARNLIMEAGTKIKV